VVGSEPDGISAENWGRLVLPILNQNQDLVVGCYQRLRFANLIHIAIVYPLLRALYGKHVKWPMARDFGIGRRLVEANLAASPVSGNQTQAGSPAQIVTAAICGGFQVCQAHLGTRLEAAPSGSSTGTAMGGGDVSSALAQVLGPIFLETERNAPFWQKLRGSQPILTVGKSEPLTEESSAVDVSRMIESFHLGFRNLQEIWNQALSPATIIGMKKLTRLAPDQFHMPDELWVRIIYDFALAFRLRVINRDHLLRALTPAYLAWVASYALEVKDWNPKAIEERIERLCGVFEAEKPYFQSRWRWPDRFNP
jgi:hypothetical protein